LKRKTEGFLQNGDFYTLISQENVNFFLLITIFIKYSLTLLSSSMDGS